ncbi:MAG: DUF1254 domain-containing protein [Thermodesulfobacteriota bacterium]
MRKLKWFILVVVILVIVSVVFAQKSIKMLKDGAQAYLYGYSLVLMDTTRQVTTGTGEGQTPVNHFTHVRVFPDHQFRLVVRPNCDTLYSSAWIDLTTEPLVLSVPDMGDRYYVMPFMDAWTNVFAYVGTRTTGSGPGHYMVAGPDWNGGIPDGVEKIQSPTNLTWLIGRIQANGMHDFSNVHRLQDQITLTPLGEWENGEPNPGFAIAGDQSNAKSKSPMTMVAAMDAAEFFSKLAGLMGEQPPAAADAPMLKKLAEFGIVPGQPFDFDQLGFVRRLVLTKAVEVTRKKMTEFARSDNSSENKWTVRRKGIGTYGTSYDVRALVSLIGLGALEPVEAVYPNTNMDITGQLLDGRHRYKIHFDSGTTPPVDAFWSLTMYDEHGFLIDNPIGRYAIGDRDPFEFNTDGSMDILIQHEQPDSKASNWLPAPADNFFVTMRLYLPKAEFLNGNWKLPPIERLN